MRIGYVTPRFYPHIGGVETHVYEIAKRLSKDFEVEVLTTDPTGRLPEFDEVDGIFVRRFRSFAPQEAYYFSLDLYRYLKRNSEKYDLVHAHNYHALTSFISYFACKNKNYKFILTPHTFGLPKTTVRKIGHKVYRIWGRKMFYDAERVILVSRNEIKTVKEVFKVNKINNIKYIPLFVNIPKNLAKIFTKDKIIITFVGRLSYEKNVDILISSFKIINDREDFLKPIELFIIGDGPLRKSLEKLAKFSANIKFLGVKNRTELQHFYELSDIFVLPSKFEVFGISVLEAMSYGLPTVLTPVGDLRYFSDKRICVFTEVGNEIDLAEKIKYLIENPPEAKKIGIRGRKYVENNHDAERIIKQYKDLYEEVVV